MGRPIELQDQAMRIIQNQHKIHNTNQGSMAELHYTCKLYRLEYRQYANVSICIYFSLTRDEKLLDNRDMKTRLHDGVLFILP